jgi:DNA-binding transcriptional LysR family regulator
MIDELRQFLLVVEHGTFTRAARHAHLSQPALTAAIQRLEQWMGARLLHRDRKGATLTAAGEALVPRARAALAAIADAKRAISEIEGLHAGEIRIGAISTAATYLLPPLLAAFRRRHPDVRIVLRELPQEALRTAIETGELDFAVMTGPGGEPWRRDEFILVGAPRSRFEGSPFITFVHGTTTRAMLDRYFPDATIVMELGSIAAVKSHVRARIGIALLSSSAAENDLASGRLVRLRHPATPIPRELVIAHRGVEQLAPAAAALRALLLESKTKPARTRASRR